MANTRLRVLHYLPVAIIIFLGIGIRIVNIDSRPLWDDEAESSINALTILDRGYPFFQYLGLPVYENTLITSWPESSEYEFKDPSYSDRGFAIYHGWLPLYSIAASFAVFGITPDTIAHPTSFRQTLGEFKKRNLAARFPAIVFSILTMISMYVAGRLLWGDDGGLAALTWSAFHETFVFFGWQARYYSATLAFITCGCVAILLSIRRGRWRDFVFVGLALVCLFHTHILSFFVTFIIFVLSFPMWRRHHLAVRKSCLAFFIIGMSTVPWLLFTGFLTSLGRIPSAWSLLTLPDDLVVYLPKRHILAGLLLSAVIITGYKLRSKLPIKIQKLLLSSARKALFFLFWTVLGIVSFCLLIPASSFFIKRMLLIIIVPVSLLAIQCLVPIVKVIFSRWSPLAAPISILFILLITGMLKVWEKRSNFELHHYAPCAILSKLHLGQTTRIYSTPSDHFVLTFYTGLPVQSIAPVRKEFLDSYEGDVVLINDTYLKVRDNDPIGWQSLRQRAAEVGEERTPQAAKELSDQLAVHMIREDLADLNFAADSAPRVDQKIINKFVLLEQRRMNQRRINKWLRALSGVPILSGFDIQHYSDFWPIFFYRFVDPDSRRRLHLNYHDRFRNAVTYVDPRWVVRVSAN